MLTDSSQMSPELDVLLAHIVESTSDAEAIVCGQTRLNYRQLSRRVKRLAASFGRHGLGDGAHIAILERNCHRYVEAQLAAAVCGAALVPLNHRLTTRELADILRDSDARALLVGPTFLSVAQALRPEVPGLTDVIVMAEDAPGTDLAYERLLDEPEGTGVPPAKTHTPSDLVCLSYTSGTTGRPKGVMVSASNLAFNVETGRAVLGLTAADRYLHVLPMFHRAGIWAVLATLRAGGCVALAEFRADHWLDLMQCERITVAALVPTMLNLVVQSEHGARAFDLSSWRLLVYGASPMPEGLADEVTRRFGVPLLQSYGMTEAIPGTYCTPADQAGAPETRPGRLGSVGRAAPGVELRVFDDTDHEVPAGTVGEIVMRGPNVMLGYWRQPELSSLALRNGWMHTGDLGWLDQDGYLYLADRKKDMIITGGENVYSTEVERALGQHPAVLEAAVIGVPDPVWGEAVKAFVVLKPGHHVLEEEQLRAFCRERIAGYKVPRSIELVESLPKTATGKVSKKDLRAPYWTTPPAGVTASINR